ncbi:MAG: 30S ribosome-binding factor RbfA [Phycisphaerales bacterium]|nr:30S ribosome-binding factor RbfA [Phycisphaerales bacterium]MCI0676883.1 30S ribosome-binding factor RbfA [Phycisphaerales bacterium]
MTQRTEQIAAVIRAAVQDVIIRGLNDPRVRGLISVTKVEVTPDLSDARVFVSILPAEHSELTMHGLQSAARHIQSQIAGEVTARRLPRLSFRLDESLKKQAMIDAAIAKGRQRANNDDRLAETDPAQEVDPSRNLTGRAAGAGGGESRAGYRGASAAQSPAAAERKDSST